MKAAIIFCAALLATVAHAKDPLGDIESVQTVEGIDKQKIYIASKMWIANRFRSAQDVIQFDDKGEGTIIAKGLADFPCSGLWCIAMSDYWLRFTIRIDTKDGKFKTLYSDLIQEQKPSASMGQYAVRMPPTPIYVERNKKDASALIDRLNLELKDFVIKNASTEAGDNW